MFKTTLAGLRARKLRLFTTGFAVLLGVAFICGSLVLTDTIGRTFDDLFTDVYKGTDVFVRGRTSVDSQMGVDARPRVEAPLVARVRAVDGVRAAEGSISGYAQLIDKGGKTIGNPGQGAPTIGANWTNEPAFNSFTLAQGTAPREDDEVVIDALSAKRGPFALGDTAQVLTKAGIETVRIAGIARFGKADSPGGASFVGFTTATAQRVITAPAEFNGISVAARPGVSQDTLRDRVAKVVPAADEVVTGATLTKENQDAMAKGMSFFNTFMLVFALVALFVGSFIIYNTFSILVAQRSREMALLRAIGASRRQVLGSVMLEAACIGVIAGVAGIAVGLAMAVGLKALLKGFGFDIPAGGLVLASRTIVVGLVAGTGVSAVSAVLPARRAARVAPVAAMRDVAVEPKESSRLRVAAGSLVTGAGVALLAAGLFAGGGVLPVAVGVPLTFIGVAVLGPVLARPFARVAGAPLPRFKGMTGTLARANATRNPKRTSATAAALMIGVGLVGFITVFATSAKASIDHMIDTAFRGDYVLDSGMFGMGGLPPEMAQRLEDVPEVGSVTSVRLTMAQVAGKSQGLAAVDPEGIGHVFDLDVTSGELAGLDAHAIAVSSDIADKNGWSIGTAVPVRFASTGDQNLTVKAIYGARELAGDYLIGFAAYDANVPDRFDYQVYVDRAPGVSAAKARAAIEKVTDAYPSAKLQDQTQFKAARAAQVNQMLGLIYALLGLAVLIALLGIANTLALSIFERTHELGLLRAVGMTRAQLRSTIRWESVLIALFGTGLGLVIGTAFGWALVRALHDQGITELRIPAGQLAFIALIAALCGILAAVLPARRAARLDVLAAIATA